jgi:hypothetical protein
MEAQKVDLFMMVNAKYFEGHHLMQVRDQLLQSSETKSDSLTVLQFKDPTTALIISVVGGGALGIDRFYIGDTGLGIAKLLTCGGLGIWILVDWFLIMSATKEKNLELFLNYIHR